MQLTINVDGQSYPVDVPDDVVAEAHAVFEKMDRDMDGGWQMSREWVDRPDTLMRCQIAADRLLAALERGNRAVVAMMAGYILTRLPGVTVVRISDDGDMSTTEFDH